MMVESRGPQPMLPMRAFSMAGSAATLDPVYRRAASPGGVAKLPAKVRIQEDIDSDPGVKAAADLEERARALLRDLDSKSFDSKSQVETSPTSVGTMLAEPMQRRVHQPQLLQPRFVETRRTVSPMPRVLPCHSYTIHHPPQFVGMPSSPIRRAASPLPSAVALPVGLPSSIVASSSSRPCSFSLQTRAWSPQPVPPSPLPEATERRPSRTPSQAPWISEAAASASGSGEAEEGLAAPVRTLMPPTFFRPAEESAEASPVEQAAAELLREEPPPPPPALGGTPLPPEPPSLGPVLAQPSTLPASVTSLGPAATAGPAAGALGTETAHWNAARLVMESFRRGRPRSTSPMPTAAALPTGVQMAAAAFPAGSLDFTWSSMPMGRAASPLPAACVARATSPLPCSQPLSPIGGSAGSREPSPLPPTPVLDQLLGSWCYGDPDEIYIIRKTDKGQLHFDEQHHSGRRAFGELKPHGRWFLAELFSEEGEPLGEIRLRVQGPGEMLSNFRGLAADSAWGNDTVARKNLAADAAQEASSENGGTASGSPAEPPARAVPSVSGVPSLTPPLPLSRALSPCPLGGTVGAPPALPLPVGTLLTGPVGNLPPLRVPRPLAGSVGSLTASPLTASPLTCSRASLPRAASPCPRAAPPCPRASSPCPRAASPWRGTSPWRTAQWQQAVEGPLPSPLRAPAALSSTSATGPALAAAEPAAPLPAERGRSLARVSSTNGMDQGPLSPRELSPSSASRRQYIWEQEEQRAPARGAALREPPEVQDYRGAMSGEDPWWAQRPQTLRLAADSRTTSEGAALPTPDVGGVGSALLRDRAPSPLLAWRH